MKKPEVFCITETWLNDTVEDNLLRLSDYNIYRNDRLNRRGGGTAIFIRHGLDHERKMLPSNITDLVEATLIDIKVCKTLILCIYIPPDIPIKILKILNDKIVFFLDDALANKSDYKTIITGDFNHFNTCTLCDDLDLIDIVRRPTRMNSTLDHILISAQLSDIYSENNVQYDSPIGASDHLLLTATPYGKTWRNNDRQYHKVYDLRNSNLLNLMNAASTIDWLGPLKNLKCVDSMWREFHSCLSELLHRFIPCKTIVITDKDKEWMTPITKGLINDRWKAFREKNWTRYNFLKGKVKEEIEKAKKITATKLMESSTGLWKLTNLISGKNNKDTWKTLIIKHGGAQPLSEAIADIFAEATNSGGAENEPTVC